MTPVTPVTPSRFLATRGVPSGPARSVDVEVDPPGCFRALEDKLKEENEDIDRLGERIAELSARIQAATYELLVLIRAFDEGAGWNGGFGGFRSCAHWLNWRTGLALGAAREKVRVARALGELPRLSSAMQRGNLSYSKVRALTRVATPANESALLDFARCATAEHVERLVRAWRRVDRVSEVADDRRRHESRHLETWVDDDWMVVIRGRLSPEVAAVVRCALEAAADRLRQEVAVGQSALEGMEGLRVSAGTSRRLACDAATVVMRHGRGGRVLDVGRKRRTISPALRRALTSRDPGCRFPGCQARHCDAHHVRRWAAGGATRLDNLVRLCRHHHRAVREEGFTVTLQPDGTARFCRPGGRPLPTAPPAPRWDGPPLAPTLAHLDEAGITIDPRTGLPHWLGERLDEVWVIDVMWKPRARVPW